MLLMERQSKPFFFKGEGASVLIISVFTPLIQIEFSLLSSLEAGWATDKQTPLQNLQELNRGYFFQ